MRKFWYPPATAPGEATFVVVPSFSIIITLSIVFVASNIAKATPCQNDKKITD
jgi:hypothetical protein